MGESNLVVLLESDKSAMAYFNALDEPLRAQISANPEGIYSFEGLQARAEFLKHSAP